MSECETVPVQQCPTKIEKVKTILEFKALSKAKICPTLQFFVAFLLFTKLFCISMFALQCRHLVERALISLCFSFNVHNVGMRYYHRLYIIIYFYSLWILRTQMASFALFPSIARVFTLKSTPDESPETKERNQHV